MKLGIAQIHTVAGDLAGTAERIRVQAELAADRGVDLLVFPLPTLVGLSPVPPAFQREFLADVWDALVSLSGSLRCACLVPLVWEGEGDVVCDVALLDSEGAKLLRLGGQGGDPTSPLAFAYADRRVRLVFSYDALATLGDADSFDLLICLSDLEFAVDDPVMTSPSAMGSHVALLAAMTEAWVAVVEPVGGYGSRVYMGGSYVLAPDGRLVGLAASCEEDLLFVDVDNDDGSTSLSAVPADARYLLWQALVMGTHDYVAASGAAEVVLGLDGRLPSAILAVIACDAFGSTHVHALADAKHGKGTAVAALADALHLPLEVVGGEDPFPPAHSADLMQLALARRARELRGIVLSSEDKTACALCERRGQVVAPAFMPLADVLRTDLLAAARLRNAISPVFPSLALSDDDIPPLEVDVASLAGEGRLACIDDAIGAVVSGDAAEMERVEPDVVAAVLSRMRLDLRQLPAYGRLLVMSECTLYEASLPMAFGWRPALRPLADAAGAFSVPPGHDDASEDAYGVSQVDEGEQTGTAPSRRDIEGALRETLDLLRDMSLGDAGGWQPPFSEN